jgi:hypothetical protein
MRPPRRKRLIKWNGSTLPTINNSTILFSAKASLTRLRCRIICSIPIRIQTGVAVLLHLVVNESPQRRRRRSLLLLSLQKRTLRAFTDMPRAGYTGPIRFVTIVRSVLCWWKPAPGLRRNGGWIWKREWIQGDGSMSSDTNLYVGSSIPSAEMGDSKFVLGKEVQKGMRRGADINSIILVFHSTLLTP